MRAWKGIGLRTRVYGILGVLIALMMAGGFVTMWYVSRMNRLFAEVIQRDVQALESARDLEIDLVKQKGFTTYYFLDANEDWIKKLDLQRASFERRLSTVLARESKLERKKVLEDIRSKYASYDEDRKHVIGYYRSGDRAAGIALHKKIRSRFYEIITLSEKYQALYEKDVRRTERVSRKQAGQLNMLALTVMGVGLIVAAGFAFVLGAQILGPISRLALEAGPAADVERPGRGNEVSTLRHGFRSIMREMDATRSELVRSRERLLHSEKMALVGRLGAEVAHSIRNPLTSVHMRLFSLRRALELNNAQVEDFEVVTSELRRLDLILQNFLSFSRPAPPEMQPLLVSDVMDLTLQLMQKRLENNRVGVYRHTNPKLPLVNADIEQLKEIFVNLISNACEAMGAAGGKITISEEEGTAENIGRAALVRISDNGPGIPHEIQGKIFEPFYTTKSEGTGLGLAIAARILEDHGGTISVRSEPGFGATFTIILPISMEANP